MNLLHIDSSILGEGSASRVLTREIVARLKTEQPDLQLIYRDLAAEPLPHFSAASVAGSDPHQAARDAATLEEFLAADVLVIGAPLYNFSLPSQLKAWIDRISIKGKTFRYTANGPEGLVGDKKVIVAIARGGVYQPGAGMEFGEPYLKLLFGFLGVKEVSFVRAEGLNVSAELREASLRAARAQIRALPSRAATALAA
jgi:FMN-dependent NADH-azoreductase